MVPRCVTLDPGSSRLALVSLKLVAAGAASASVPQAELLLKVGMWPMTSQMNGSC